LQKVFETFQSGITNHYIYAPRLFFENSKNLLDEYKLYLSKIINNDSELSSFIVVDTVTTGNFSSQKLLQSSLDKVTGFYWCINPRTFSDNIPFKFQSFAPNTWSSFTHNWNFMEFLLTSPELPIKNIKNSEPIYDDNPNPAEIRRSQIYPFVSKGAVKFAHDINKIFGGRNIFLDSETIIKWINIFCDNPAKTDMDNMSEIYHSVDSDHKQYMPLFGDAKIHFWQTKIIKEMLWQTKLQIFGLNILSPIKIKTHGLKMIRLLLLPELKQLYFICKIKFSDKCYYEIRIGEY
jgi:predicted HAD superfamily hydrolase